MTDDIEKQLSILEKIVAVAADRAVAAQKNPNLLTGDLKAALESIVRKCERLAELGPDAVVGARAFTGPLLATLNVTLHGEQASTLQSRLQKLHPDFKKAPLGSDDDAGRVGRGNGAVFSGPSRKGSRQPSSASRPQPRQDATPTRASPFKAGAWVVQKSTGEIGYVVARMGVIRGLHGDEWQLQVDVKRRGQNLSWSESELRLATEEDHQRLRDAASLEARKHAEWQAARDKAEAVRLAEENARVEEEARREVEAARRAENRLAKRLKARGGCKLLAIAQKEVHNGKVLLGRAAVDGDDPAYVVFKRVASGKLQLVCIYRGKGAATRVWNEALTRLYAELNPDSKEFNHLCAEVAKEVRRCLAKDN